MNRSVRLSFVVLVLSLLVACSGNAKPPNLPAPVESTSLGVGDEFAMQIIGEEKLPSTYVVAPDGTVAFPYVNRVHVDGLEPQEVEDTLRNQLINGGYYKNPVVTVLVKSYNSKRIEIIGEIKKPGSLPMEPGMTLLRAVSLAGGFTPIADHGAVTIRRKVKGGIKIVKVDVDDIIDNSIDDVPLQAGDTINIGQTIF
jgi:protein involved in polysaccharide export with SLBB domain